MIAFPHAPTDLRPTRAAAGRNCGGDTKKPENDACRATYKKLEELGCIEKTKDMFARGCFADEIDLRPADCDSDSKKLDPCIAEIRALEEKTGAPFQALDEFLMANCNPSGPKAFEMPAPDLVALRQAKETAARAKVEAEAAKLAAEEKAAAEQKLALEQARTRSVIKLGMLDIRGGASTVPVLQVMKAAQSSFTDCHAAALVNPPDEIGKISINFLIGPQGTVSAAIVQESTIDDRELGTCIASVIKQQRFSPPTEPGTATVTIEIEFDVAM